MSRRTVAVGDMEDVSDLKGGVFQVHVMQCDYVSLDADTPLSGTMWAEARRLMDEAQLTVSERRVFVLYNRGLSVGQIANHPQHRLARSTVQSYLDRARAKCAALPNIGMLTTMIEILGWAQVRECLRAQMDRDTPRHPAARHPGRQ